MRGHHLEVIAFAHMHAPEHADQDAQSAEQEKSCGNTRHESLPREL
jgi:hypothetical protein